MPMLFLLIILIQQAVLNHKMFDLIPFLKSAVVQIDY